jgi:hypothetical protein
VQRSVRLRSSASAYFNRVLAASGTTSTFSAWVKRGALGSASTIFGTTDGSTYDFQLTFTASNTLEFYSFRASAVQLNLNTTQVFRDPSAWYHIVLVLNTTQATAANRAQIFINGVQVTALSTATYPAQNAVTPLADSRTFGLGNRGNANNNYFDGYLTEINYIDGQVLTPTSFGAYNSYGVWSPAKYTGTYGTNGFYLNFQDNSGATATTIGKDSSGNGNNWTPNNISVTAGVTYDSMTDVPTLTSATNANFCVLNSLARNTSATIADGNGGFVIHGRKVGDGSGSSVNSAGDINGDGFDDLIIGAPGADGWNNTTDEAGESYVVFGKADGWGATIDLASIAAGAGGFAIYGQDRRDSSGFSVASAGDINGDGFADLIIGAYGAYSPDNSIWEAGESYLVFGQASGWGASIDLSSIVNGEGGFVIYGQDDGDRSVVPWLRLEISMVMALTTS